MKVFPKIFTNNAFGFFAEIVAIIFYIIKLYTILHHRKKLYTGEVDIIAVKGKTLVFIEVKARTAMIDSFIISEKQKSRIRRSADLFISQNNLFSGYDIRFDLFIFRSYRLPMIIENAW